MKFAFAIVVGLVMFAALGVTRAPAAVIQPPTRTPAPPLAVTPAAANCDVLQQWATDLRARLDDTLDPLEHAHLASRLEHVHNQEDSCSP